MCIWKTFWEWIYQNHALISSLSFLLNWIIFFIWHHYNITVHIKLDLMWFSDNRSIKPLNRRHFYINIDHIVITLMNLSVKIEGWSRQFFISQATLYVYGRYIFDASYVFHGRAYFVKNLIVKIINKWNEYFQKW